MNSRIISPTEAVRESVEAVELDSSCSARSRHARYFENGVVYHVVSRTCGNLFLLRPDLKGKLRQIIAGVLAHAKECYPNVSNFALSALSNHLHAVLAALSGDPKLIADYIGYFKRETTRRWRREVGWHGSLWNDRYKCSAIITSAAQVRALRYVVGQGVKEDLVVSPRDWPGFHCAESLVTGKPVRGYWFNGTRHGKAKHAESAKKSPRSVRREDYFEPTEFSFDPLPALAELSPNAYRAEMAKMVADIVEEGARLRGDKPVLGPEAICATDPRTSRPVPDPPWFEERKRMIVWDSPKEPEVKAYLGRYWEHQKRYRAASGKWLISDATGANFPDDCFVPGLRRSRRPIAHMEQGMG